MSQIPYVVGNWKMYKTNVQAVQYIEELLPLLHGEAHWMLSVPYTSIESAAKCSQGKIMIGAQNMYDAQEGAFTGEIAASMLKEVGAVFVLLGHSERRRLFKEDHALIHRKLLAALQEGLLPILCVGETLEEREGGKRDQVLQEQLITALEGVQIARADQLLIAYEPVWAIGTGKTATPAMAGEVHASLRTLLCDRFGEEIGRAISMLYGGSVHLQNVEGLMGQPEIGGVLVGGASLDPKTFATIANKCAAMRQCL